MLSIVFAAACTVEENTESKQDVSFEDSSKVNTSDIIEESSPKSIDTNMEICAYNRLNYNMEGDIVYGYGSANFEIAVSKMLSFCDESSMIYKTFDKLEYGWNAEMKKPDIEALPKYDDSALTSGVYHNYALEANQAVNIESYPYTDALAKNMPFFIMLETVVPAKDTVSNIQNEKGITAEEATALYRSMLIETFEECGIYLEGWFDWYTFDSRRAWAEGIAVKETKERELKDYMYDESVYKTSTHYYFIGYATSEQLEALKERAESSDNTFFKVSVTPVSGSSSVIGVTAYPEIPKNGEDTAYPKGESVLDNFTNSTMVQF